jgi:predicted alpha/beta-hydrolase family hydrolase
VTGPGTETLLLPTPRGDARAHLDRPAGAARGLLVLGHGAGGGVAAPDLVAVRAAAVRAGLTVALVEQPYRVAGRRAPPPAPALDEAWVAAVGQLSAEAGGPGVPLVVGGRSSGARVACRTATDVGAAGVIALAFPVRPPQRPDRDRLAELALPTVPVLVVQGDRDPFGVPPRARRRTVRIIPGADHSLRRDRAAVTAAVLAWLTRHVTGRAAATGRTGSTAG